MKHQSQASGPVVRCQSQVESTGHSNQTLAAVEFWWLTVRETQSHPNVAFFKGVTSGFLLVFHRSTKCQKI